MVEKAIQCNVQKLIRKYNKTATNENVEPHLNQSCSNPIQYDESQFCIEVNTNSEFQIKPYSKFFYLHNVKYIILYCYPFPQSFSRDPVAVRIGQEFHLRCAVQGVQNPVFRVIKDEKYCLQQSLSDRFVYSHTNVYIFFFKIDL